jgi:hypothetical protein
VLKAVERVVVESMTTEQLQELDNDQARIRAYVQEMDDVNAIRKDEEEIEKEISEIKAKREKLEKPEEPKKENDVNYAELHKKEVELLTKKRIEYADIMTKFSSATVCGSLDDKIMAANIESDDILEKMGSANENDMTGLLNQYIEAQKQAQLNQILKDKFLESQRQHRA